MLIPEQKKEDKATQTDSEEKLGYKNSEILDKGLLFRMEDQSKSNKIICKIEKSLKEINEIINKLSEDLGYENKKLRKLLEKTKSQFEESLKFRNPAYIERILKDRRKNIRLMEANWGNLVDEMQDISKSYTDLTNYLNYYEEYVNTIDCTDISYEGDDESNEGEYF